MLKPEQLEELKRICDDLETQDNRATADPVFVVFGKDRIAADADRDHDGYWYYNSDIDDIADDEEAAAFEVLVNKGIALPNGWEQVAYKEIDVFQAAFLTENGAKAYLKANGHNIKQPFIYAHSFYRNREMLTIRECLPHLVTAFERLSQFEVLVRNIVENSASGAWFENAQELLKSVQSNQDKSS